VTGIALIHAATVRYRPGIGLIPAEVCPQNDNVVNTVIKIFRILRYGTAA
jgi:hypothetical protein